MSWQIIIWIKKTYLVGLLSVHDELKLYDGLGILTWAFEIVGL